MPSHREIQKKYCSRAIMAALLLGAGLILAGLPALGKGLIAGTLFSILNFILIAESLPYKLGKSRPRAAVISMGWILLRLSLMAIPLVLALKFHLFDPAAAAVGLFGVQLVILAEQVVRSFRSSSGQSA